MLPNIFLLNFTLTFMSGVVIFNVILPAVTVALTRTDSTSSSWIPPLTSLLLLLLPTATRRFHSALLLLLLLRVGAPAASCTALCRLVAAAAVSKA
jgi:hypothetical protein